MTIKIKVEGNQAVCWIGEDESDSFVISGRADTVDAIARILRVAGGTEHELSQRGAAREPFVNDATKAEVDAAAKVKAEAEAKALADAEAAKLVSSQATIKAEIERLNALLPQG